jgi:hypothetical protein
MLPRFTLGGQLPAKISESWKTYATHGEKKRKKGDKEGKPAAKLKNKKNKYIYKL